VLEVVTKHHDWTFQVTEAAVVFSLALSLMTYKLDGMIDRCEKGETVDYIVDSLDFFSLLASFVIALLNLIAGLRSRELRLNDNAAKIMAMPVACKDGYSEYKEQIEKEAAAK